MHVSPRVLGVASLVLVAGVASGAVIGKVPPMKYLAAQYYLPQAADGAFAWSEQKPLPDHYPIVTPEGRFEVYQLAERGLYRQARYAPQYYAPQYYDFEAEAAELAYDAPATADDHLATAAVEPIELAAPATIEPVPQVEPAPMAEEPEVVARPAGSSRIIDVAAELAAQS